MRLTALSRYLLLLAALFVLPGWALAQQSSGNIEGIIKDTTGAVIGGAEVTVTNLDTGFTRTLQTTESGFYRFASLEVGTYSVKINATGFAPTEQTGIRVQIGSTSAVDFAVQVGNGGGEVVTITAEAPVVETTRTQFSSSVDERSVRDLPVNGRNFQEFVLLTPGVSSDPRGGDISFGGLRGTNNSLQIDGADNNNTFFGQSLGRTGSGRAPYQFSKEAVREFQVNTNAYSAEYGRAGGAVINVVTKSGTNEFHGGGFIFFRDRSLNANETFAKAAGRPEGRNRIYQYGAILSGPIAKDKAFFFFNFDGQRNSEPNAVFVPRGSEPTDAVGRAVLNSLSNLFGTYDRKFNQDVFLGKVDYQVTSRDRLTVRFNHQEFTGTNLENSGNQSALEHTGNANVKTDTVTVNVASVLSSKVVNEARFQFARDDQPGQANTDRPEAVIRAGAVTAISFGRNNFSPRQTKIERYQFIDAVTLTAGTHAFKFGIDVNKENIKNFFPGLFSGTYTFTSFADFADGKPSGGYQQAFAGAGTTGALTQPDNFEISFYAQDDWRVTSRLKFYYGLRYDYQRLEEPKITNPNPQLQAANIDTGRLNQDLNNLGPRVGLAYSVTADGKTLVRAGYGVFYSRTPSIITGTAISQNGIQVLNLSFPASASPVYPFIFAAPPTGITPSRPSLFYYDENFVQPYVQQGSIGIERELAHNFGVTASYLVVKGTKLTRVRDINLAAPIITNVPVVGGGTLPVERFSTVRPLSAFNRLQQVASDSTSIYHGLTLQLNKRYSSGLQFLTSYTFSKGIDDKPDATTVVVGTDDAKIVQNQLRPASDRGPGDSDVKHRFVTSGVYDLNIANLINSDSGIVKGILNDYSLSGIFTATSGRPFNSTVGADLNNDGNSRNDRTPGVGRNTLRGPNFYQIDLRFTKAVRPTETTKIEFIVEAFNLLNRTNIANINTNRFNLVNGALVRNNAFLLPTSSVSRNGSNRQIQLALKFDF